MNLFKNNNKHWMTQDEWEKSPMGSKFMEKLKIIEENNKKNNEEWHKSVTKERMEQYKLFKIIFPCIYLPFCISLIVGCYTGIWPWVLGGQALITAVSVFFFFRPPAKVKYRSVFLMAVIAFVTSIIVSAIIGGPVIKRQYNEKKATALVEEIDEYEEFLKSQVIKENERLLDSENWEETDGR